MIAELMRGVRDLGGAIDDAAGLDRLPVDLVNGSASPAIADNPPAVACIAEA
jgi:hypothetical protein